MRILYIPFFSNSNHNGCSIYNTVKVILRHWVDISDDVYIYFLLPKNFDYQEEEILNHPRIEKIYVEAFKGQHDEKVLIPSELFKLFNVNIGKHYYDLVICDKVQITTWIKLILEDAKKEKTRVPYINFAEFIAKKEGRFGKILDEYEFTCALGWLSGYNVYQNKRHSERCFDISKKYLKPFWVKKIMEDSCITNLFGVDIKTLDKFYKKRKKNDELIVNYAHRMATHYNPMFVMETVDKVFRSGENIKFVITTPSAGIGTAVRSRLKEMENRGLRIDIHQGLPQDEYYKVASNCDLFISAIDETETANSIFEQLYLGQVGIFPNKDWVKAFLPKYPFIYKDLIGAYYWVNQYLKNPERMKEQIEPYRKMIADNWDIRQNSEKVLKWIKNDILPHFKPQNRVIQVAHEVLNRADNPNTFSYEQAQKIFKKHSDTGIQINREGYRGNNKFDWIKAIKANGYKDTLEKELKFKKI